MKNASDNRVEKIILVLFLISILVDNINGILLNLGINLPISFGAVYRTVIYVLCLAFIFRNCLNAEIRKKIKFKWWMMLFGWLVLTCFIITAYFGFNSSELLNDLIYAMKLFYPIAVLLTLWSFAERQQVEAGLIDGIFKYYSVIAPLTLIIPTIFGLGFDSYTSGGVKGFYFANNEINIALVCMVIYSMGKMLESFTLKHLIVLVINILAILLIGSKTSIVSVITVGVAFAFKRSKERPKGKLKEKPRKIVAYIGVIFAFILSMLFLLRDTIRQFYERNVYLYNLLTENGSFLDFLTSSRTQRIIPIFTKNILAGDMGVIKIFTGIGHSHQYDSQNLFSLVEMDFFDTLFWYGAITAVAVFIAYSKIFIDNIKNGGNFAYKLMFVMVFAFSLVAGHVWYSALAGEVFALVCFAQMFNNKNQLGKKRS